MIFKLLAALRLIRFGNLMFIAFTQYFIRIYIISPLFNWYSMPFKLDEFHFFLLVLSTVFIAAAGYISNDYFDRETDAINKPDKVVLGKVFNPERAFMAQMILIIIGVVLGFYLGYSVGNYKLGSIFIIAVVLLWLYSSSLKKVALLGNLLVAFTTALAVLLPAIFETINFNTGDAKQEIVGGLIMQMTLVYTGFAFLISLIREIVKDLEDIEGDLHTYAKTLPIIAGSNITKVVVTMFTLVLMAGLTYIQLLYFDAEQTSRALYIFALQIPLVVFIVTLWVFNEKRNYHKLSTLLKVIMLIGILSMPIF